MDWTRIDWPVLERLRAAFLDGTAGQHDYWRNVVDLENYHETFARRIAWKWRHVLGELQRRGWTPPAGEILDWGCGSGVAAQTVLGTFGCAPGTRLAVWDRSPLAREFALRKAREQSPDLPATIAPGPTRGLLLLSHVLTELTGAQTEALLEAAGAATTVLWVEPGAFDASRRLIAIRERLRSQFHVIAPCTHAAACGLLAPQNESHWCHHFAEPPSEVFTDGNWVRFGQMAGIDLRSLPLSFLVLDRRPFQPLPPEAVRILGRPRVYKAHAQLFACDAAGVRDYRLTKRRLPDAFRALKKQRFPSLLICQSECEEVRAVRMPEPPS